MEGLGQRKRNATLPQYGTQNPSTQTREIKQYNFYCERRYHKIKYKRIILYSLNSPHFKRISNHHSTMTCIKADRNNILWTIVISIILLDAASMLGFGLPQNTYFQQYFGMTDVGANSMTDTIGMIATLFPIVGALIADAITGKKMMVLLSGWASVGALALLTIAVLPTFGGYVGLHDPVNSYREGLMYAGFFTMATIGAMTVSLLHAYEL